MTAVDVSELSNLSQDDDFDNNENKLHIDAADIKAFASQQKP